MFMSKKYILKTTLSCGDIADVREKELLEEFGDAEVGDISGVIVGGIVKHKVFGNGKVIKLVSKYIKMSEKTFSFSNTFKNEFLII